MRIIHIMKDGTIRESIDGVVVPFRENKPVYDILKGLHKQGIHNRKGKAIGGVSND